MGKVSAWFFLENFKDEFILGGYIQESSQAEVLFPVEEGPEVHQHQEVMERLQEFGLVWS